MGAFGVKWCLVFGYMHFIRSFRPAADEYVKFIETYARDRALQAGKLLHAHLIVNGFACSTCVSSKLVAFYTECGQLRDARKLFDRIPKRNTRRWIVLIGAYARRGFHQEAMVVFSEMQREGLEPNKFVLPSVLKACGHLLDWRTGERIHAVVLKYEFETDAFIGSALIDMYSKCGKTQKARTVFDGMVQMDIVAMNTMVAGYVQQGFVREALVLVENTRSTGVIPNVVTWNTLISGFSQANDESKVSELFKLMQDSGVAPDVVSWTSVISGFVQNFRNNEAFDSFKKILHLGIYPTSATISSLLPGCASVVDVTRGKEIHGYSVVTGMEDDVFVCSALIDMYAKCGFIYEAKTLFDKTRDRNTVTWNSLIFGYANNGYCSEAIALFNKMVEEKKVELDHLTFTAVLTACCHAGMIKLGKDLFTCMQERYKIEPRLEHYACMVHLFGREGKLIEAYDMMQKMPIAPDVFVWGALLGACRLHGDVSLAEIAAKRLAELEPESAGSSLLLSNLYADVGSWKCAAMIKRRMKKKKSKRLPGSSWIGIA